MAPDTPGDPENVPQEPSASHIPPVIGLGASAGGVKALIEFFENMPPDSGMCFVVIHLSPEHKSSLAELLQHATSMPVMQVTEAVPLEANHIYVIPPHRQLSIEDGMLRLSDLEHEHGRRVAIDLFFRTLSEARGRDRLTPISREMQHANGHWFLARLLPYRTMEDRIDGVVLTFVDITEQRQTQMELRQAKSDLEAHVQARTMELAQANAALQAEEEEQRRRLEAERRAVLRALISAQEEERKRISRELHDQLGQQLTGLLLGLQALKDASFGREATLERLNALQRQIESLGQELNSLTLRLRPTALDDLGLAAALANYVEEWSQRTAIQTALHDSDLAQLRLSPEIETTIYRVVMEALTNVARHAHATSVNILLEQQGGDLIAIVEDNGSGFDVSAVFERQTVSEKLGLLGMQERVALVDGTLTIESSPEGGTTVYIRIPLPPSDTSAPGSGRHAGGRQ